MQPPAEVRNVTQSRIANMTQLALVPSSAPFSGDEIAALNTVVGRSSPEQRAWLSGFLAGLEARSQDMRSPEPRPAVAAAPAARIPITIVYASESGNAEGLALGAKSAAAKQGFDARVHDMADLEVGHLVKAKNVLVFASTWGEGEPPQRAADFVQMLLSDAAPRLDGVRFAVLALGDSAYANFCETGRQIDERLAALGAIRTNDRVDLDLDFSAHAPRWTTKTLELLRPADASASGSVVHVAFQANDDARIAGTEAFSEARPLEAEITGLVNLNGSGSTRETWHVEMATEAAGYAYEPGDAIAVVPENDSELVARLLEATGLDDSAGLGEHLRQAADITTLSRTLTQKYAALTGRADVAELAADAQQFQAFAGDRQLVDLFKAYPGKLSAADLKGLLRPLPARLYSVASSPRAHQGETHVLIGAVRWQSHGLDRRGVASTFIADRRKLGDALKVYVKTNRHFRLPQDQQRPVIMIGAGTGIAPFRGFVADRAAQGAKGGNWLIFGERNFTNDFLYQLEWQEHLASGALTRLDLAFSRDQPEKIYVQHRLWDAREDLRRWIGDGAHVYVCGCEKGLWRDVDATLARILSEAAGGDIEAGKAELASLAKAGRYQRDVY